MTRKAEETSKKVKIKKRQTPGGRHNQDGQIGNQEMLNAVHDEVPEMARTSLAQLYNELKTSKLLFVRLYASFSLYFSQIKRRYRTN